MNLPNKLTLLRIALVPVCLILLYAGQFVWSAAVFALACVTDFLDGKIQRIISQDGKYRSKYLFLHNGIIE